MTGSFVGVGLTHEHLNAETLAATIVGEALGQVAGTKLASEVKEWQDALLAAQPKAHVSATPTPSASPKPHPSSHPGFFKKPSPDQLQTQARQAEDWFKKWEFGENIDQEIEEALAPHFDGEPQAQAFTSTHFSINHPWAIWKGLTSPLLMETVLETLPFEERVMFNLETSLAPSLIIPEVALTGAIGLMGRTVEMAVSASQSVWTKGLRFFGGGEESLVSTGGRTLSIKQLTKLDQLADKKYDLIRQSSTDVDIIAKNTGLPRFKVERIKQHLFFDTHKLTYGTKPFASDALIADAWGRLVEGSHTSEDLSLLSHEYFESRFEGIFKTDYITAHSAAGRAGYPSPIENLSDEQLQEMYYGMLYRNN